MDTIYAPLTLKGKCSIYVIRISGNKVSDCLRFLGINKVLKHRESTLCKIKNGDIFIDEALLTCFYAPNSFTGEDVCEISLHCSPYIIAKVFEMLGSISGVRMAERGEFSKRAFFNNRIDLLQAESIADLINSETELQHRQAINQLQGKNSNFYNCLREEMVKILSLMEAYIDFPNEHLPEENIKKQIDSIKIFIEKQLQDNNIGEKIRDGFHLSIIGEPNVGKSTLLNTLAKRDVAIVSDIAGTTRDIIEVHLDINGIPVSIYDTAGIRETADKIENEGVKRAINKAKDSDLKILMLTPDNLEPNKEIMKLVDDKTIMVINKSINDNNIIDRINKKDYVKVCKNIIFIPYTDEKNIKVDNLIMEIQKRLEIIVSPNIDTSITNARSRNELKNAMRELNNINFELLPLEINTEYMRIASNHVGKITGKIDVEEILDSIFSKFCIGK